MSKSSPIKTDFPITLGGKEFTLTYPIEALWAYEDATGETLLGETRTKEEILAEFEAKTARQRMERVIQLLWSGLITHHPDLTVKQVRSLIFLRDLPSIEPQVVAALQASMPQAVETESGDDPLATTSAPN